MLITDLSKVRDIDIVEREKLEELIKEIKLGKSSYFDQSTAQKLGKGLGAASILTGAFYILDGSLRIDARLINVETGKIIAADEVTGKTTDFFSLHKQLVNLLVKSLSINYNAKTQPVIDYDNKIELTAVVNYSNAIAYEDNGLQENASEILETTLQQYPEFLFAKTKLDKIRAFIIERERERELLLEQELNSFLANIDTSSKTLTQDIMSIWSNMTSSYSYSSLLAFNNQLKKRGIPLNTPAFEGSKITLGEYLAFYDCLALFTLKKYKLLIEPSKSFLSTYPTSMYFNSVKMNLNTTLKEMEQIETGKENAKAILAYSETNEYLKFLNSLGYYANKRFIQKKMYQKFKKVYVQKIIKGDKKTLLLFEPYDRFDGITEFFEIAKDNLDRDLMVQIKDLAIEICTDTDQEDDAYDLEGDIDDFDEEREKHHLKKVEALENLNSGDIVKIAKTVQWFWLMRDKKEDDFILEWSTKYLELKDTREAEKIYSTRLKAYENIVEALDRLGEFEKMEMIVKNYKSDEFLLKNKDREYDSQAREFKEYLRKGPKEYAYFKKNILNHDIKSNILAGHATVYLENYQYFDEISCRKEIIEKYDVKAEEKELQHYFLYIAYSKVGLYKEMNQCANDFLKLYPKSNYAEAVKTMLTFSPK